MSVIGWVLLGNTAIALVLGAAAKVAERRSRPTVAHVLWVLALVKLAMPPVFQVDAPVPARLQDMASVLATEAPVMAATPVFPRVVATAPPSAEPEDRTLDRATLPSLMSTLAVAWAAGASLVLLVGTWRVRRLLLLVRLGAPPPPWLLAEITGVGAALGLRRQPTVRVLPGSWSPMVLWVGRSILVLPNALLELPADRRRALVAHELAHLRRRDHLVRWIEAGVTCLMWWNPALWWVRRGLHEVEEQCADAVVVRAMPESREALASGLVEAARAFGVTSPPALAAGLNQLQHLRKRIQRIMLHSEPVPSASSRFLALVALFAVPALPTVGCGTHHASISPAEAGGPWITTAGPSEEEYGEAGWTVSGGGRDVYAVALDDDVSHGGGPPWSLFPIFHTYGKYGTWMRSVDAALYAGKRVRITATTKTDGASQRADVWARVQAPTSPGDGSGLGGQQILLPATEDWTRHEIVMDVPPAGKWLQYGIGIAGPGNIWFDPMTLEVVDASVPLTATRVP